MFLTFLQSSIRFSTIFLFGSVGETLTEKSGNLNLGIPGVMCMGAAGGIMGASAYVGMVGTTGIEPWGATLVPILFCLLFSALGGLIYCVLTATLRCNQNVSVKHGKTFFVSGKAAAYDGGGLKHLSNLNL